MMQAQEGLRAAPPWQQRLTEWAVGSSEAERDEAIRWYEELVDETGQPLSHLRLAILYGETGRRDEALAAAGTWRTPEDPDSWQANVIEAAYGVTPVDRALETEWQAILAERLPAGWFYDALAARLAERAGDRGLFETVQQQRLRRGLELHTSAARLMMFELGCLAAGSMLLVLFIRGRRRGADAMRLHSSGVPPPWPARTGTAVLVRGGALGAVVTVVFLSFAPPEHVSLRALAIPLANLPLLGLAYLYLLRPAGLTFREGFGLSIMPRQIGRLSAVVVTAVALGLWGEWVMGQAAETFGLTNHWTEWVDPDLGWSPPSVLVVSLLEYVVFAPIFEELAFRGLLYAMLRRRMGMWPAALMSACVFALAHGYGVIGFASVLWSGVLWAWLYERTGSLLPGMLAHAANNLMVCMTLMALLR